MSPLVVPPARGYPDGQRVINYDTPLLWSQNTTVGAGPYVSTVQDVSRFAYLGGVMGVGSADAIVSMVWYEDQAATIIIASRKFVLSHNITDLAQLRFPNLGPFVQITVTSLVGANFSLLAKLFGTNRVHPLELIPINPVLINQQAVAIALSSTNTVYPTDYYSGPVDIWFSPVFATWTVALQFLDSAGNWDFVNSTNGTASNATTFVWTAPSGAWRVQVTNSTGAASTYYLAVTPTTTGAI